MLPLIKACFPAQATPRYVGGRRSATPRFVNSARSANGLSYALGVAAARWQGRDGKIVLFEGDGGLLFHIQELETLRRQGFRILICAMNDGGYGSEFHKLRAVTAPAIR